MTQTHPQNSGQEAMCKIDIAMALRCVLSLAPLELSAREQRELEAAQLRRIAMMAPGLSAMTIVSVIAPPLIYYSVNGVQGAQDAAPWISVVIIGALGLCAFIWPMRQFNGDTPPKTLLRARISLHVVSMAALFAVGLVVNLINSSSGDASENAFRLIYVVFIGMAACACTVVASYSNPLISASAMLALMIPFVWASVVNTPEYAPWLVVALPLYSACFWSLGVNAFQNFLELEVNSLARQRQADVIALLLGEMEAQSSDWIWETNAQGALTHVPPQMVRASAGAATAGVRLQDLADPGAAEAWPALVDAVASRRPFRGLQIAIGSGEKTRHWLISGAPRRDGDGGYRGVASDQTARIRAETAQRESDLLVRSIVEASPTTFLVSRVTDGKILYFPPASQDRFGAIESTLSFFLTPEDRVIYLNALLPTGIVTEYPVRFRRGDGSVMEGLTSARVIDYRGEQVIISSTRDVTEFKAMEAELERQRKITAQNEKMSALGGLLAGVSHELSNPLSIVGGYAMMLEEKLDDPALARQASRIVEAADRCARIVKTFLAMARERPARAELCDLNEVIETAWEVAGGGVRALGGEATLDLDPTLPDVEIDPDQIAQVFANLILNAGQAMELLKQTARFNMRTWLDTETGDIVAEFRDNGPGVPEEIIDRVFDPFFTTKPVGEGTGVGLALSHRIVNAHGGRLAVESPVGEGACFSLRLPAAHEVQSAPEDLL